MTYGRKPRPLLNLDSNSDIKVLGTFKEYYELLNKRLKYLHDILLNFRSKRLAMLNRQSILSIQRWRFTLYFSPLTSQLQTALHKVPIRYVGPVLIYKIIDSHFYLLMTLDGKTFRGLFEHKRLNLTNIRMSQGNVQNVVQLRQIMNTGLKFY